MVEPRRVFTLEEARRALPLVRRIAADMQQTVDMLVKLPGGTSFLYGATPIDNLTPAIQVQARQWQEQIDGLAAELREIGVELKGFQPVLVDFPSWRDEEMVFLCWAEGEDDIAFWHAITSGFRSRQPL
jgi:hypothetical protein